MFSTRDLFKGINIQYRVKFLLSTKLMIEIILNFIYFYLSYQQPLFRDVEIEKSKLFYETDILILNLFINDQHNKSHKK